MTKRGRPPGTTKSFLADPDRFAVALIDALQASGVSERKACDLVAGTVFGRPVAPSPGALTKVRPGWEVMSFETASTTIDGKASGLRKKAGKATSEQEVRWRSTISSAFFLALFRQDLPFNRLRDAIRLLCDTAGEPMLGNVLLQEMIAPRNLRPELFSEVLAAKDVTNGRPRNAPICLEAPRDPDRSDDPSLP